MTAGAPTMYDAVERVERYLNRNFTYSEKPPRGPVPAQRVPVPGQVRLLPAVLGRDGADAADGRHPRSRGGRLRARLAQPRHRRVPRARPRRALVGGGLLQRDRLGHVRPDARRRAGGGPGGRPQPAPARRRDQQLARARVAAPELRRLGGVGRPRTGRRRSGGCSCRCVLAARRCARAGGYAARAALAPAELAEAQLAELRRALARLGWDVPAKTTLLGLERRLGRAAGLAGGATRPGAAGVTATTRAPRVAPALRERRALRRDLTARPGLRGRWSGWPILPGAAAAGGLTRPHLCGSKEVRPTTEGMNPESPRSSASVSNLIAGVLGGLVVLVIGAILIATDVIDTGDTTRGWCEQAPISQPATDPGATAVGQDRPGHLPRGGRGVVFIQAEGVSGGETPVRRAAAGHGHRLRLRGRRGRHDHHQRARRRRRLEGDGRLRGGRRGDRRRGQGRRRRHRHRGPQDRPRGARPDRAPAGRLVEGSRWATRSWRSATRSASSAR